MNELEKSDSFNILSDLLTGDQITNNLNSLVNINSIF